MSDAVTKEPKAIRGLPGQIEVFPFVHADLLKREAYGDVEYGGPLVTGDGRSPEWDGYQEALDLAVFMRRMIIEKEQLVLENNRLKELYSSALDQSRRRKHSIDELKMTLQNAGDEMEAYEETIKELRTALSKCEPPRE